jgi:hypothetical protein
MSVVSIKQVSERKSNDGLALRHKKLAKELTADIESLQDKQIRYFHYDIEAKNIAAQVDILTQAVDRHYLMARKYEEGKL